MKEIGSVQPWPSVSNQRLQAGMFAWATSPRVASHPTLSGFFVTLLFFCKGEKINLLVLNNKLDTNCCIRYQKYFGHRSTFDRMNFQEAS